MEDFLDAAKNKLGESVEGVAALAAKAGEVGLPSGCPWSNCREESARCTASSTLDVGHHSCGTQQWQWPLLLPAGTRRRERRSACHEDCFSSRDELVERSLPPNL